ncbi:MAG: FAD-dependent oxidoreductase [Desulfatiglandales bacterium]
MVNNKQVLVIGGGIAGLTAAQELSRMGISVFLIEKGLFFGGRSAHIACKATDKCMKCNDCLVEDRLREISESSGLDISLRTEVENIETEGDRFRISLRSRPKLIDPEKCTDCGLCFEKCPEAAHGAIVRAPSPHIHPFFAIDPVKCSYFAGQDCGICQSVCPEKAINLDRAEELWSFDADGLVLATGYEPFDPEKSKRYNFSHFKNMVTGVELEKMLRDRGHVIKVSDGSRPEKVAFVQCVGSRDTRLNHEFCSRVCCGFALRMGLKMVHDNPETEITVFYMDIQNFGKDFDRYYREAQAKIRLLRGLPGDFYAPDNNHISVSYCDERSGRQITEDFYMVVLSVGIMPSISHAFFAEKLSLSTNKDGFLKIPDEIGRSGLVMAGTVEGPMDVSESISHAKRSALEMGQYLGIYPQNS